MDSTERDAILLTPNSNSQQLIDLRYEASIYADSVKFFVDRGLRPTTELGDVDDATLHSCYAALCKEHGLQPLSAPRFIAHLKTIIPKHRLERRWSPMVKGKRRILPARWQHITFVQNAFSNIGDSENSQHSKQSSNQHIEPVWVCHKSKCVEGGLFEFEQFWNSDPPDSPGGGGVKGGGNPPCPPDSLGSINLVAHSNGGSANGSTYFLESQSPKSSNGNTLSRVDRVDQVDRGKTLALETKNNLSHPETFSDCNCQSTQKDGDPPDPLSPTKLTITSEQGVQANWETHVNSIVQMLACVQTVDDRHAVEQEARRLGFPRDWKKLVRPLLDEETLSKLKRLKQQSIAQRVAKEYQFQVGDKVAVKSEPHLMGKVERIDRDPNEPKPFNVCFEDRTGWYAQEELETVNQSSTKLNDHQLNNVNQSHLDTEKPNLPVQPKSMPLDLTQGTCPGEGWLDFPGTGGKVTRMNQALQICNQLKQAKTKSDLNSIKVANGWANDAQVNWVCQHLLTDSERQHIETMGGQIELNLFANCSSTNTFETSSTNQTSLVGKWVKLQYSDGITAYHVVGETMTDGVQLIEIELAPGVVSSRYPSHVIEVFDRQPGS